MIRNNKAGFSIIDLFLIVGVIVIIAVGFTTMFNNRIKKTRLKEFKVQMNNTVPYIFSCLANGGRLLNSENNDMISEDGGEICNSSHQGTYESPKKRMNCNGDGVFGIFANSESNGLEATCNLGNNDKKCVASCTTQECNFVGECD